MLKYKLKNNNNKNNNNNNNKQQENTDIFFPVQRSPLFMPILAFQSARSWNAYSAEDRIISICMANLANKEIKPTESGSGQDPEGWTEGRGIRYPSLFLLQPSPPQRDSLRFL